MNADADSNLRSSAFICGSTSVSRQRSSLISRCENVGVGLVADGRLALADGARSAVLRMPPPGGGGAGGSGRSLSMIVSVALVLVDRSYDACGTTENVVVS